VGKYKIGYSVEKTKSYRATCCFCGKLIKDEFRLSNMLFNRYCHISCSGFTFSRITEMIGWDRLQLTSREQQLIYELVRKH